MTIEQAARHAGVTVAAVSRVLNNSPTVKKNTSLRVREAIKALNYIPNQSARNLRRNESRAILALAPDFSSPYYSHILTVTGFDDADYTTMFHPYLTTVSQPCYEMGRQSVVLCMALLQGKETPCVHLVPHSLVERESAGQCP